MRISKTKGGAKGRYLVNVLATRVPESALLPELDPRVTLRYLWNCKKPSGQGSEATV
jgi:hypothetical protein